MTRMRIGLPVKILVSGLLIWALVSGLDVSDVLARIAGADAGFLSAATVCAILQILASVARWRSVIRRMGAALPFASGLRIYLVGMFFNQALPSTVGGDAVRIYQVHRCGMDLGTAANGVLLERIATVIGLVLVVDLALPFHLARFGAEAGWLIASAATATAGSFAAIALLAYLDRTPLRASRWKGLRALAALAGDTRQIFLRPGNALAVLGWSLLSHALTVLLVHFIAQAMAIDVSWLDCAVLVPPVLLVITLPISIAGWGVREQSTIAAFGLIGIPAGSAFGLSVLFGLMMLTLGTLGGLAWFARPRGRENGKDADLRPD